MFFFNVLFCFQNYSSNDLVLYCDHNPPSLKWLPWPKDDSKKIVSLAFKSTSEKLLVCGK